MPEALGEAGGELRSQFPLPSGFGGWSRIIQAPRRRSRASIRSVATPVASAKPWIEDRPRRQGLVLGGLDQLGGAAEKGRGAPQPQGPHRGLGAGGGADQGAGALHVGPAGHERAVARQRLLDGLGVDGLEAGVEQVAHRAGDRREAVRQILQPAPERRLGAGGALGEDVEQAAAARRGLPRALQDLGGEAEQGLHRDPGHRPPPPPHDRRRHVEPQAARGDDDPHRHLEQRGVPPDLGEESVEALHQQPPRRRERRTRSGCGRRGGARAGGDRKG